MGKDVQLVPLSYRDWDERFVRVVETIGLRSGHPAVTIGLREQKDAPRNTVLCYADPKHPGHVCLVCNPLDREAFEVKLGESCRLADLSFQQIGPISC